MWLSGQQKRPADCGEGQTGIVTVGGDETAVMLDSERRGLEVYVPAGYHWTPEENQRVLVIQGQGEIPCIVGVRRGSARPKNVSIQAKTMSVSGRNVSVRAEKNATVAGQSVDLEAKETAAIAGQSVELQAEGTATVAGQSVDLQAGETAAVVGQSVALQAGETAAVAGQSVVLQAKETATIAGQSVVLQGEESAAVAGKSVDLQGEVFINGEPLEAVIARIAAGMLGG